MIFMRLIKEITSQEAQLLYDLCYLYRGKGDGPGIWSVADAPGSITEAGLYGFLVEWTEHRRANADKPFRYHLIEKFEIPGVFVRSITYCTGTRGAYPYDQADDDETSDLASPPERKYPRISYDILRGLNLLNEVSTEEVRYADLMVSVAYCELCPLGVEFLTLCNGGVRVKPPQGSFWSPDTGWARR